MGKPLDINDVLRNGGRSEPALTVALTGADGQTQQMDWRHALLVQLSAIDANTKAIRVAVEKIAERGNDARSTEEDGREAQANG